MTSTPFEFPQRELVTSGHLGCQGCTAALAMRLVLKALGEQTVVVMPACCWTVIAGPYPYSALRVPLLHTAFETAASTASGVRAALDILGDRDTTVLAWAGDGGTFDIGLQALSAVAERNEDILYVCYDNEAYMNTGIQRSSATPRGAWTTTTPGSKLESKKDIMGIMGAHRIPYAATAAVSHPEDLITKLARARGIRGTRFIHLLCPCPPGWQIPSERAVEMARLAVLCRIFPLYEVYNGEEYHLFDPGEPLPVETYLTAQGRFRNLPPEALRALQQEVDQRWHRLCRAVSSAGLTSGTQAAG